MSKRYYQGKRYYTKNTVTDSVLLNRTMAISLFSAVLFCLLTSSTVPTEVAPVLNYLSYLTLRNSGYLTSPFSPANKHRLASKEAEQCKSGLILPCFLTSPAAASTYRSDDNAAQLNSGLRPTHLEGSPGARRFASRLAMRSCSCASKSDQHRRGSLTSARARPPVQPQPQN